MNLARLFSTLFIPVVICSLCLSVVVSSGAITSLYEHLGGREMLRPMVSDFVDVVVKDDRIRLNSSAKKFLDRTDTAEIKAKLMDLVCEATGGPCRASSARSSLHSNLVTMELTASDWEELQGDLGASLTKFSVSASDQAQMKTLLDKARQSFYANP